MESWQLRAIARILWTGRQHAAFRTYANHSSGEVFCLYQETVNRTHWKLEMSKQLKSFFPLFDQPLMSIHPQSTWWHRYLLYPSKASTVQKNPFTWTNFGIKSLIFWKIGCSHNYLSFCFLSSSDCIVKIFKSPGL